MKKSMIILLALAVVVAMAMPAMALDVSGEYEVEYKATGDSSSWASTLELDLTANPADNVSAFAELEADTGSEDLELGDIWISVDLVEVPGLSGQVGRFDVGSVEDLLYDDGVNLLASYSFDNIGLSLASDMNLTEDDVDPLMLFEASMSDIELGPLVSTATLNFKMDQAGDSGFSLGLDNSHEMADFYFVFANSEENAIQLGASTVLTPELSVGLDFGMIMDNDYTGEADLFGYDAALEQTALELSAAYIINEQLTANFEFGMFDADDGDDKNVITLGAEYDLASNTALELEFESYDSNNSITSTLTTSF